MATEWDALFKLRKIDQGGRYSNHGLWTFIYGPHQYRCYVWPDNEADVKTMMRVIGQEIEATDKRNNQCRDLQTMDIPGILISLAPNKEAKALLECGLAKVAATQLLENING